MDVANNTHLRFYQEPKQLELPLPQTPQPSKKATAPKVCIGNCNICPYCDRSDNR